MCQIQSSALKMGRCATTSLKIIALFSDFKSSINYRDRMGTRKQNCFGYPNVLDDYLSI